MRFASLLSVTSKALAFYPTKTGPSFHHGVMHRAVSGSSNQLLFRCFSAHAHADAFSSMEIAIQKDVGRRGIGELFLQGQIQSACEWICNSKHVGLLTGFPCNMGFDVPTETDGPPGTVAVARACLARGKKVTVLTDQVNEKVLKAAFCEPFFGVPEFRLEIFPPKGQWTSQSEQRLMELGSEMDCIVAIERCGPAKDGRYYTMRGRELAGVAPLERILPAAGRVGTGLAAARTVGVGDGGNEVGMGKVLDRVLKSSIPNAEHIACTIPTDALIVAGVSNWGGYALAAGLHLLDPNVGDLNWSRMEQTEKILLERMLLAGARDGVTTKLELTVDGIDISVHLSVLHNLFEIALKATGHNWKELPKSQFEQMD